MQPRLTVSGYRGVWGETLTEDIAKDYVRAFGSMLRRRGGAKVLVGRDGRKSGPILMETIIQELLTLGFDVIDLGMMPTPTVLYLVRTEGAAGAVIVTASHNPIQYNGLKFATETGAFTTETDVAEIESLRSAMGFRNQTGNQVTPGIRTNGMHLFQKHLDVIAAHVDFARIQKKTFKVAIDPINSVGCTTTPQLLELAGASVYGINTEPTGEFAHEPEPVAKNLSELSTLVRGHGCDVGFAQDPDGDRLVIADETGELLSEELTLPLCLMAILSKTTGTVVMNLSTSNVSEDIAAQFGCATIRSKVGEANVVQAIREHGAVVGGEGSSGPIWPATSGTRDSFTSMALILELMASDGRPLSEIAASLPKWYMDKSKFPRTGELSDLYTQLITAFPEATIDTQDGLRLDFPDRSWVQARPSNTEPIVRIFAEAATPEQLKVLYEKFSPVVHSNEYVVLI